MYSQTKWVRSVVQLLAIVAVIVGIAETIGVRQLIFTNRGEQVARNVKAPDPETTGSILKIMQK